MSVQRWVWWTFQNWFLLRNAFFDRSPEVTAGSHVGLKGFLRISLMDEWRVGGVCLILFRSVFCWFFVGFFFFWKSDDTECQEQQTMMKHNVLSGWTWVECKRRFPTMKYMARYGVSFQTECTFQICDIVPLAVCRWMINVLVVFLDWSKNTPKTVPKLRIKCCSQKEVFFLTKTLAKLPKLPFRTATDQLIKPANHCFPKSWQIATISPWPIASIVDDLD